ncbi:MAG: heme NO-binding domain-containing protein [Ktedonobacteraceae bacterium]
MHGLIFVTWEKYLLERFQWDMVEEYRRQLEINAANTPLAIRTYPDELLLAGVGAAHKITSVPVDTLLREYGHYFIANSLTRHRCAYLLNQAHNGRDLLLAMRNGHEQMAQLPEGLTPPLFEYRVHPHNAQTLALIYDSPRQLCPLLQGAIEGSADYYGEQVSIAEQTCMRRGDPACTFLITFSRVQPQVEHTLEAQAHLKEQQLFADQVFQILPTQQGLTLGEIQEILRQHSASKQELRPALILQALTQLHHAGLVASSANEAGDEFTHRRYWSVPMLYNH